jgi:arylsulfatase
MVMSRRVATGAVSSGRVDITQPMAYSADKACDVGADTGLTCLTRVRIHRQQLHRTDCFGVQLEVGGDSHDHLIPPEDRLTSQGSSGERYLVSTMR